MRQKGRVGEAVAIRHIYDSPLYLCAQEDEACKQGIPNQFLEAFTAFQKRAGRDANPVEVGAAYAYAWAIKRRADFMGLPFREVAEEICHGITDSGLSWETVLNAMGSPSPGIAFDLRENLS